MSDRIKIVDSRGCEKYLLDGNTVTDLRKHVCEKFTDSEHQVCLVCGKDKPKPNEENIDV